jgi:hypothetical protein
MPDELSIQLLFRKDTKDTLQMQEFIGTSDEALDLLSLRVNEDFFC